MVWVEYILCSVSMKRQPENFLPEIISFHVEIDRIYSLPWDLFFISVSFLAESKVPGMAL